MPDRILIVKLSSMGDVLHTLPAARALRQRYPQAHLGWAVERAHAGVLTGQSWLDETIVWERGARGAWWDFIRRVRRVGWDLAIDFQGLFRSALVTRLSGAARRVGSARAREFAPWFYTDRVPIPTLDRHAVERSMDLIASLGCVAPGVPLPRPYLDDRLPQSDLSTEPLFPLAAPVEEQSKVDAWLAEHRFDRSRHRLVALNPHCRKDANRWPAERFTALAERLLAHIDVRVALIGGGVMKSLGDQIAAPLGDRLWRADGKFSLLGTAELLRHTATMVTGDTGPMHIAAAVGTPIVALFGPANPLRTGPYASDAIVLNKRLACSPCFAKNACPLGHAIPACMDQISVDEVVRAVELQLARDIARPALRRSA